MKKLYILIFISTIAFSSTNVKAVTIPVSITNFAFTPSTFTANVGDVVVWTLTSGTHTVVGLSVPNGAAAINSGAMAPNGTYSYTITVSGSYGYKCGIHPSMLGGFSASGVGILEPVSNLFTSVYPNPFKDKLTVKYNGIESIDIFNVVGEKVKSIDFSSTEGKIEVDLSELTSGVYFYRTYREKNIVETKKIIKTK